MTVSGSAAGRAMWIRLLGPFALSLHGRPLVVLRPRQQALLALLALRADEAVGMDQIIDAVWESHPPRHVRNQVHVQVSGLRASFAQAGWPRTVLATRGGGYQLCPPAGMRDIDHLDALTLAARNERRAQNLDRAAAALRTALGLWHGRALAGIEAEFARTAGDLFEERRLALLTDLVEVRTAQGQVSEVLPDLMAAVRSHPLHEGLRLSLMQALYRTGRRAEALAVYRHGRHIMVDQLGVEPGQPLRSAEAAILREDFDRMGTLTA